VIHHRFLKGHSQPLFEGPEELSKRLSGEVSHRSLEKRRESGDESPHSKGKR
jgi:hypothetical protein